MYQGPQSERQVEEDIKVFGGSWHDASTVLAVGGTIPLSFERKRKVKKAKYPIEEVMSCGGANYLDIIRAPETPWI